MGKIKPLTVLLVCVLVITAAICIVGIAAGAEGDKTDAEKMREMADRVEDAILSVDDSYKKQIEVVTYPLTYKTMIPYLLRNTLVVLIFILPRMVALWQCSVRG